VTSPASTTPIARAADPAAVAGPDSGRRGEQEWHDAPRTAAAVAPVAPAPAGSALDAHDITVAYGDTEVVHGAGLELRPGCVTVLVGPNGSGKSTLLRTMARLQSARSGSLTLREEGAGDAGGPA
jgi:iron-chelate-transporting ATPase